MTRFVNTNTPREQRQPGDVLLDFVGSSYELVRKKVDVQRVINMFPSPVESGGGKSPVFLKSIAGLTTFSVPVNIVFITYVNQRDVNPDTMHQPVVLIPSGTLL